VVVAVTILATAIGLAARWTATRTSNSAVVTIRRQVYDHAIQLPLQQVQEMKSGGVSSLIREDAGGVAELIFSMLYNPWRAIVQFVGSLIILMLVDWKLMLGGLLLLPIVWVTHRTWINRIRPLFRDIRKQRQGIDATATETFGGIRVVRTFARRRSESARFVREGDFLVRQQLYTWWWTRTIELIWEVVIPLASTGLLLYGGYQIIQAELTLGELMMFLVYLTMLLDPLATLAGSAVTFQTNLAALDRVLDVMEQDGEFPENPAAVFLDRQATQGAVSIRGVSFAYPKTDRQVLHEIDLEVQPGETVALVGRSGSGKTTLTNLIARFYDPTSGSIQVDGHDLRDVDPQSYRRMLGIVEQDVFLFDGSIRENILYARRRASDDEMIAAAQAAAADEFISALPDGYETRIGERGFKLSGGQRQRIAIARAILADPKILILDEATSNLDSESERLIQQSLSELLRGRTAFVIAHRLSTIRGADKIVVVDDGRIVQVGTHDALLEKSGRYRDMILLQTTPELVSNN
jgi:ATP-binding cassette subfamily B protein/subfamily B ATP-binding cassette protein MsbA